MITNTNNKLIKILERKNIIFAPGTKKLFNKYSYYQVINAYKCLFVSDVENIENIHNNINNNIDIDRYKTTFDISTSTDLFKDICKKISKKYGISLNPSAKDQEMINTINKIKYIHHIYPTNTKYDDFIRMYKFEHELRLLLLRYTLIIEENVKNIFTSYLNNINSDANYLSNINNYDTSKGNNNALDTLALILSKQKNKHSKPVLRKRVQDITVPYWILINELAMNQTYKVIKNLKPDVSEQIFQNCVNFFTKASIDINDKKKAKSVIEQEKNLINAFKNILSYIGDFRNMLAHNQPIFSYNVKDCDLQQYPIINYQVPYTDRKKTISEQEQQYRINAKTLIDLQAFFGADKFNRKNYRRNINLSWMIYLIYKIIDSIDKNTNMYNELYDVFSNYNIVLSKNKKEIDNINEFENLLDNIKHLTELEFNSKEFIDRIDSKQAYKKDLKKFEKEYSEIKKKIFKNVTKLEIKSIRSKYPTFTSSSRYKLYTGIDKTFFSDLK